MTVAETPVERLKAVVVGVDEARHDEVSFAANDPADPRLARDVSNGADRADPVAIDEDAAAAKQRPTRIHRPHDRSANQEHPAAATTS
jgi:hypothetical protein